MKWDAITVLRCLFLCGASLIIGALWVYVINGIHDGQTWWSGISSSERELTFVSEQAFYYYYFKRATPLTKDFWTVLQEVMNDNTVEYPTVCNALQRFNVYPELSMAVLWRTLTRCGVDIPILDFYKYVSWLLNGLLPGTVLVLTYVTTGSLLGTLIGPLMMFANFSHLTRAPTSLGLRETLAIPIVFVQFMAMHHLINTRTGDLKRGGLSLGLDSAAVICATVGCFVSWQLCGNLFLLQVLSLLGLYSIGHVDRPAAQHAVLCHGLALSIALLLLFGNLMLAASWYTCVLVSMGLLCLIAPAPHPHVSWFPVRLLKTLLYTITVIIGAVALRVALQKGLAMQDDAHIFNLLRAKLGSFRDFHTSIYLRIAVFQALPIATYWEFTSTGLLCGTLGTAVLIILRMATHIGQPCPPRLGFLLLIGLAHAALANFFMRLKFLWTPLLCVMCASFPSLLRQELEGLMASKDSSSKPKLRRCLVALEVILTSVLAAMAVYNSENFSYIQRMLAHEGSYQREVVLALADHVRRRTPPDANIFGDMITTSAVVLMTGRRVAIHPHYEDVGIRSKIYQAYHWAAYRRLRDVHKIMTTHNITHVVDTPHLCWEGWAYPSYARLIEEGEYGNPPPSMPVTKQPCCRAARKPNKYFQLLERVADDKSPDEKIQFWLYRVVPQ